MMDNRVYNGVVSFIWGIADDCLRDEENNEEAAEDITEVSGDDE
jgi:hypothetical protein